MKFTKIHSIIIIGLVLFSLAGLLAIQFSWLKGAMVIQEQKIQEKLERVMDQIKVALGKDYQPQRNQLSTCCTHHTIHPKEFIVEASAIVDSILQIENLEMEYGFEASSCSASSFNWYRQSGLQAKKEAACELHLEGLNFTNAAGGHEHLHLYAFFPQREQLIFKEMSTAIGSSILFVLLLMAAFGYLLRTIFRQKKLSEMKNDFINNLTHEFKTPLASVSLAARTLKRLERIQSSEKAMSYVNLIDQEGKRLDNHIDKILQIAALDSGNFMLDKQEVDLHEIIRKVKDSLSLMVEKNGGKIKLQLQAIQPTIAADALHLFNVVYNLVDNAIKYNQHPPLIIIDSREKEAGVQIDIQDNGIGMTAAVQKQVFDRFFRQTTGNVHNVKGFGLGLAYVKRMMDAHGGTIEVNSQPGLGTTFSLVFPRK